MQIYMRKYDTINDPDLNLGKGLNFQIKRSFKGTVIWDLNLKQKAHIQYFWFKLRQIRSTTIRTIRYDS